MGDVVLLDDARHRREADTESLPPPHDLAAQAAVISACMLDGSPHHDRSPSAVEIALEVLAPHQFFGEAHARMFQAIQQLAIRSTPVDVVTVGRWLAERGWLAKIGGAEELARIVDATPILGHVEAHVRAVRELYERRHIIAECLRVQADGRGAIEDHEAWKAAARRALGAATAPRSTLKGRPIGAVGQDVRAHVREMQSGPGAGVWWGLGLDVVFGPLARGQHHVLAGESEHGKTSLAWHVAVHVASHNLDSGGVGEAVYFMSADMSARDLLLRGACSGAGVDALRFVGGWATPDESQRVAAELSWLEALPIIIDDEPAPPAEIARRVRAHREAFAKGAARDHEGKLYPKCRLQLVIGDHLQKLAERAHGLVGPSHLLDRIEATSHGWANAIAKDEKAATLLLSQLKSAKERKLRTKGIPWPDIEDLWGGNPIRADADRVVAVCRPELLRRKLGDEWRNVLAVLSLKGRFGGTRDPIRLGFEGGRIAEELPAAARGEPYYGDEDDT